MLARVLEATPGVQLRLHCSTDVLPELEDRVRAMGLEAHVTLLDARPDTPPPPDGIAVIFSAFGEPVDTPFALHALGAGHPIAAARHPQLGDWLKDGDTALTVPPGDETALSDALLRLLHDPALAQRLAANAHTRAQARHTWAAFIEALLPQEST